MHFFISLLSLFYLLFKPKLYTLYLEIDIYIYICGLYSFRQGKHQGVCLMVFQYFNFENILFLLWYLKIFSGGIFRVFIKKN